MRTRTRVVIGIVVAAHCVLACSLLFTHGCRSTRPSPKPDISATKMPPPEVETTKPIFMPPVAVAPAPTVELKEYVVRHGDNLSSIAQRHGVNSKELVELNGIKDSSKLQVGQHLKLPAYAQLRESAPAHTTKKAHTERKTTKEPKAADVAKAADSTKAATASSAQDTYVVQAGDSLSKIASKFHTTAKAVREANKLQSDSIRVHQKLAIPPPKAEKRTATTPEVPEDSWQPKKPDTGDSTKASATGAGTSSAPKAGTAAAGKAAADADAGQRYTTHEVEVGETLDQIASKTGVAASRLMAVNGLKDKAAVKTGMLLKIPLE